MIFTLEQIAAALNVPGFSADTRRNKGWSIDSRTIQPGEVFFALRGPHHDGHAHLGDVFRKGALAAVVDANTTFVDYPADGGGRLLRVGDTLHALQQLAAWARRQWGGRVIAITGSAGKTTTKDVVVEMMSVQFKTGRSEGNLNNHIGLPVSLLRLDPDARAAVVEMGMNHAGEIGRLAEIARPDVGVVTNVSFAHLENFTSIEGIAAAKRELIEALPAAGAAVLNADDSRVVEFARAHSGRTILYGESASATVRAEDVSVTAEGATFRVGETRFQTSLPGRHNVSNILAGIAVAEIHGIAPRALVETVHGLHVGKMRGERIESNGMVIYNDCYNSNPAAARAMLDVLRDTPAHTRIAVLGEMGELGAASDFLHRGVGTYAAHNNVDILIGVAGKASQIADAARAAGLAKSYFFADPESAGKHAAEIAHAGDAILFKGSRAVRVELALQNFLDRAVRNGGTR